MWYSVLRDVMMVMNVLVMVVVLVTVIVTVVSPGAEGHRTVCLNE